MSQPLRDSDFFTPPPQSRPYGAPADVHAPAGKVAPTGPGGPQLAAPSRRLLARLIDGVLILLISVPVAGPLLTRLVAHLNDKVELATATGQQASLTDPTTIRLTLLLTGIVLVVSFIYEVPQLARWGQTVGKRVCRVQVVRRDGGVKLGVGAVILRWLTQAAAPQLPWIGIGIFLLDSLWLLWDRPWRQCLHDKAASTIVIAVP